MGKMEGGGRVGYQKGNKRNLLHPSSHFLSASTRSVGKLGVQGEKKWQGEGGEGNKKETKGIFYSPPLPISFPFHKCKKCGKSWGARREKWEGEGG